MAERKPRQMTFDQLQRKIKRDEWRALMKTEAKWEYVEGSGSIALGANRIVQLAVFTAGDKKKTSVYAVDVLVTLNLTSYGTEAVTGAIIGMNIKPGMALKDAFVVSGNNLRLPKNAAEAAPLARFAQWLPLSMVEQSSANAGEVRASMAFPLAQLLRRGRLNLLPGESYSIALCVHGTAALNFKFQFGGRYRAIQEDISV